MEEENSRGRRRFLVMSSAPADPGPAQQVGSAPHVVPPPTFGNGEDAVNRDTEAWKVFALNVVEAFALAATNIFRHAFSSVFVSRLPAPVADIGPCIQPTDADDGRVHAGLLLRRAVWAGLHAIWRRLLCKSYGPCLRVGPKAQENGSSL